MKIFVFLSGILELSAFHSEKMEASSTRAIKMLGSPQGGFEGNKNVLIL
jgi:hypothetical protein